MEYGFIQDQNGVSHKYSKVILGAVPLGTTISEKDAFEILDLFQNHGGNVIDTARVYCDWLENGQGVSERTVGSWLKARNCRAEMFILTKGGHPLLKSMEISRLTKEDIFYDVEESLKALQTDYIDLYFLHRDDESIPVKVIIDTLTEVVESGKVRMIGASNWRIERILEANEYARKCGKIPFVASQIQWSYAKVQGDNMFGPGTISMDEQQYQQYLLSSIPVFAYTSQGNGVFSQGYKADLSDVKKKHQMYCSQENIERYKELKRCCEKRDISPTQFVLEYIIKNPLNGFAVVGCSKREQLFEILNGVGNGGIECTDRLFFSRAKKEDISEIMEFYSSLIGTPGCAWSLEYPTRELIERDILAESLYLIKENEMLISVAFVGLEEELECFTWQSKNPADIARIGVILSRQGHGIGSFMLNKVIEEARKRGFDGIRMLVSKKNLSALALYDKNGFIRLDEVEMYGIDFYRYERLL